MGGQSPIQLLTIVVHVTKSNNKITFSKVRNTLSTPVSAGARARKSVTSASNEIVFCLVF